MTIQESNKLIAIFMGAYISIKLSTSSDFYIFPNISTRPPSDNNQLSYFSESLKYHTSWDWLMPVVEKIENLKFIDKSSNVEVIINSLIEINACGFFVRLDRSLTLPHKTFTVFGVESKFQAVYSAVVNFIKWYNEQK